MNTARSEAQQRAISEALWRVMSRGGIEDVTLRAVAAEAGCTTGLVTSRFPNKRALLLHARRMLHERTAAAMDQAVTSEPDPSRALYNVLVASSLTGEWAPAIWLGFITVTLSDEELRTFHIDANRHFLDVVRALVSRIQPSWDSSHTTHEAIRLVGLVTGLAVLAAADPETYSEQAHRQAFTRAIENLQSTDLDRAVARAAHQTARSS